MSSRNRGSGRRLHLRWSIGLRRRRSSWVYLELLNEFQGARRVAATFCDGCLPVIGRERDAPNVAGRFKFEPNLKKFANGARTLHPNDASLNGVRRPSRFGRRNIQSDRRLLGNVVLRLVLTTVAVHHHGGSALFEGLPQRIHTRHRERHRLHDSRAAALLRAGIVGQRGFVHPSLRGAISKGSTLLRRGRRGFSDWAKGLIWRESGRM